MIFDQVFYFVIVIGVLVTVHEFGHFIAARLCGMRTDVFSIGFGTRLFGFNKRSGFTFLETPPNCISIPLEKDATSIASISSAVRTLLEQTCRDFSLGAGMEMIDFSVETPTNDDPTVLTVTFAQSKTAAALATDAEQLRTAVDAALRASGSGMHCAAPECSFAGAGMCDYRVALLPLGGYVKIAGMVDESMDTGFLHRAPQPWEFRAHPAWQRIIVISGGVAMNIVLAAVLFIGIRYHQGEIVWKTRTIGVVAANSSAFHAGLQAGDNVVAVDGAPVESWMDLQEKVFDHLPKQNVVVNVRRNGSPLTLTMPEAGDLLRGDSVISKIGLYPEGTAPVVVDVAEGTPAAQGGVLANDAIIMADSMPVHTDGELISVIRAHASRTMSIDVRRGDSVHRLNVTPGENGRIGIAIANVCFGPKDTTYSLFYSLKTGIGDVGYGFKALGGLLSGLISGRASVKDNLGGPIAIAKMAGRAGDMGIFTLFALMASLSISLAGLNILPVPALDGGHLLFIIIEAVLRREVSNKVKMVVQQVGFALLLLLMVFVLFNDLRR